jgi:hypothetical protein
MKDDPGLLRALKQVSETDVGRKRFCGVLIELLDCPRADLAGLLRAAIYNVMPYGDYLKTSHWKRIAREAKERAGNRCQLCNAKRATSQFYVGRVTGSFTGRSRSDLRPVVRYMPSVR